MNYIPIDSRAHGTVSRARVNILLTSFSRSKLVHKKGSLSKPQRQGLRERVNKRFTMTYFADPLTIRNESKTDYPMNQSDLLTRVGQIGEHGRRLSDSRQKSSRYWSAVMMVVKICQVQLMQETNSVLL